MKILYHIYKRKCDGEFWEFVRTYSTRLYALKCEKRLKELGFQVMFVPLAA